jgi:hypothetical protein
MPASQAQVALIGAGGGLGLGSFLALLLGLATKYSGIPPAAFEAASEVYAAHRSVHELDLESVPLVCPTQVQGLNITFGKLPLLDPDLGSVKVGDQEASIWLLLIAFVFGLSFWALLDVLLIVRNSWSYYSANWNKVSPPQYPVGHMPSRRLSPNRGDAPFRPSLEVGTNQSQFEALDYSRNL